MHYLAKRFRAHTLKHPAIYVANLILSFHFALLIYINSSFLELHMDKELVGIVFGIGAFLSVFMLLMMPKILRHVTNADLIMTLAFVEFFVVAALAMSESALAAACFFILHEVIIYALYYGLDISLEEVSSDKSTGWTRAVFMTFANVMFVASPLIVSLLILGDDYSLVYLLSAFLIIPFFALIWVSLRKLHAAGHKEHRILDTIHALSKDKNVRNVMKAQFLLNFFFAWMVVYMPIYLHEQMGFAWSDIGLIFAIMLLPFVLFEIPVGRLADKVMGEKEIMIAGFAIMSIFTFFIPALPAASIGIWAFTLFMTRVGASFVEATTESYFWKHVNASNTDLISFFRIARPLGYGIGPVLGALFLYILPFEMLFSILSIIMLCGVFYALKLKDTK
jgi:MFS family permease